MSLMTSVWILFLGGIGNILITTNLYNPYRSLVQRMLDSSRWRQATQDNRGAEAYGVFVRWLCTSIGGRISMFIVGSVLIAMTAPVIWG